MMDESDKIKQRQELLKMARDLLIEDYINQRAMEHNKWVEDNDEMWRKFRRRAPYPAFTPYPTDQDIIKAAEKFYSFAFKGESIGEPVQEEISQPSTADPIAENENHISMTTRVAVAIKKRNRFYRGILWLTLIPYRLVRKLSKRLDTVHDK
jgi:hypothetical protein